MEFPKSVGERLYYLTSDRIIDHYGRIWKNTEARFKSAISVLKNDGASFYLAQLYSMYGRALHHQGKFALSLFYVKEGREMMTMELNQESDSHMLVSQGRKNDLMMRLVVNMAMPLIFTGRNGEALILLKKSLVEMKGIDYAILDQVYNLMGLAYQRGIGDNREALIYYNACYKERKDLERFCPTELVVPLNNISMLQFEFGNKEQARQLLERALDIQRNNDQWKCYYTALTLLHKSEVCMASGNFFQALMDAVAAKDILKAVCNEHDLEFHLYHHIAHVLMILNREVENDPNSREVDSIPAGHFDYVAFNELRSQGHEKLFENVVDLGENSEIDKSDNSYHYILSALEHLILLNYGRRQKMMEYFDRMTYIFTTHSWMIEEFQKPFEEISQRMKDHLEFHVKIQDLLHKTNHRLSSLQFELPLHLCLKNCYSCKKSQIHFSFQAWQTRCLHSLTVMVTQPEAEDNNPQNCQASEAGSALSSDAALCLRIQDHCHPRSSSAQNSKVKDDVSSKKMTDPSFAPQQVTLASPLNKNIGHLVQKTQEETSDYKCNTYSTSDMNHTYCNVSDYISNQDSERNGMGGIMYVMPELENVWLHNNNTKTYSTTTSSYEPKRVGNGNALPQQNSNITRRLPKSFDSIDAVGVNGVNRDFILTSKVKGENKCEISEVARPKSVQASNQLHQREVYNKSPTERHVQNWPQLDQAATEKDNAKHLKPHSKSNQTDIEKFYQERHEKKFNSDEDSLNEFCGRGFNPPCQAMSSKEYNHSGQVISLSTQQNFKLSQEVVGRCSSACHGGARPKAPRFTAASSNRMCNRNQSLNPCHQGTILNPRMPTQYYPNALDSNLKSFYKSQHKTQNTHDSTEQITGTSATKLEKRRESEECYNRQMLFDKSTNKFNDNSRPCSDLRLPHEHFIAVRSNDTPNFDLLLQSGNSSLSQANQTGSETQNKVPTESEDYSELLEFASDDRMTQEMTFVPSDGNVEGAMYLHEIDYVKSANDNFYTELSNSKRKFGESGYNSSLTMSSDHVLLLPSFAKLQLYTNSSSSALEDDTFKILQNEPVEQDERDFK